MRMTMFGKLLVIGCALMFAPLAALACSCVPRRAFSEKLPDRGNTTVAVFTAEVVRFDPVAAPAPVPSINVGPDVDPKPSNRLNGRLDTGNSEPSFLAINRRVEFRTLERFAGPEAMPAEVWTHSQSSACGFEFSVGKKYLVEAQFWPPDQPRWIVTSCSRTAELERVAADEDIRMLQLWKGGMRPPGWIRGRMFGHDEQSQIAGVRLQLTDGKVTQFAQSGTDGTFGFANLSPGVYMLTADVPGTRNKVTVDLREQWSAAPTIYVGFP